MTRNEDVLLKVSFSSSLLLLLSSIRVFSSTTWSLTFLRLCLPTHVPPHPHERFRPTILDFGIKLCIYVALRVAYTLHGGEVTLTESVRRRETDATESFAKLLINTSVSNIPYNLSLYTYIHITYRNRAYNILGSGTKGGDNIQG